MKDFYRSEDHEDREERRLFSRVVKAGPRTYFFDVKKNRRNDYFIVITESKRNLVGESEPLTFEKHKIQLFYEDISKFMSAMKDVVSYVRERETESIESE
ncbi:MAG: PUR family DNA/RNA-binding protein [Tannerella sp.]|jgi:hypothetical protein|nr:PUR family DNA/RNA-binding protein [Tannerella sp.]